MSMLSRGHIICKHMHYPPGQLNRRSLVGVVHIEPSVIFFFPYLSQTSCSFNTSD